MGKAQQQDETVINLTLIGVAASGLALAAAAMPAPTATLVVTGTVMTLNIANTRPPVPFTRVSNAWNEASQRLVKYHTDLSALIEQVNGQDGDLWSGPGAQAFYDYANNEVLPSIQVLADASKAASDSCMNISDNFASGLEQYFILTAAYILVEIASDWLYAVPVVGAALAEIVKFAAALLFVVDNYMLLKDILSGVSLDVNTNAELASASEQIKLTFGRNEGLLDQIALEKQREQIAPIMDDPGAWSML